MFALAKASLPRAPERGRAAGFSPPSPVTRSTVPARRQAGAESSLGFAPGKASRRLAPAGKWEWVLETHRSAWSFPRSTQEEQSGSPLHFAALKTTNPAGFFFLGDATRGLLAPDSCPRHPCGLPSPISRPGRAQPSLTGQPGREKAA